MVVYVSGLTPVSRRFVPEVASSSQLYNKQPLHFPDAQPINVHQPAVLSKSLDPKIWGPPTWSILHTVSKYFDSLKATADVKYIPERQELVEVFSNLQTDLPCSTCCRHYTEFWKKVPFRTNSASQWTTELHNHINQLSGKVVPKTSNVTLARPVQPAIVLNAVQQKPIVTVKSAPRFVATIGGRRLYIGTSKRVPATTATTSGTAPKKLVRRPGGCGCRRK